VRLLERSIHALRSTRIPQLKVSEGQTWSSEDTRLLVSKSFLVPARSSICLPSLRSALTAAVSQRQNALSSLRKVCSLLMTSRSTAESGFKSFKTFKSYDAAGSMTVKSCYFMFLLFVRPNR
jgi:hypothetical protein